MSAGNGVNPARRKTAHRTGTARSPTRRSASLVVLFAYVTGGDAASGRSSAVRPRSCSRPPARWWRLRTREQRGDADERDAVARHALSRSSAATSRAIRAPRGTELNARSWSTEAPLRMLLNNLDPEVAERPEELVVYGGSGKAARNPTALRALVRSLLELGEDETLLVQSGKPVGVFRTHPGAPRVLIANSLLVPRWATWDEFRRLEALGLTMFGQMTAGSWIYIGTPGDPAGHVPDVRRRRRAAFRLARPRRADDPDSRARGHGRCAAARGHDGRRGDPLHRGRPDADRAPARDALPRRGDRLARRRARARARGGGARDARCRSACSATPPTSCPSSRGAASTSTSSPTRRRRTIRSPATSRRARRRGGGGAARARPGRVPAARARVDRAPCRGDARVRPARQLCFRLWQQPSRGGP